MKALLPLLVILLVIAFYINRSYANFYSYINQPVPSANIQPSEMKGGQTLVALGDSLFAGLGAEKEESLLPNQLAKKLSQKPVQVVNLAISGATTQDIIDSQLPQLKSYQPQYITLLIGTNDLHNNLSTDQFENNYRQIIQQLKVVDQAQIILFNLPYLGSERILTFPISVWIDEKTRQFNQVIEQIGHENQLKVINLYNLKEEFDSNSSNYSNDNFHPSDIGYQTLGRAI